MTGLFLAIGGLILGFQYPEGKWAFWLLGGACLFMTMEHHPELIPSQPEQPTQVQVQYQ